MGRFSGRNRQKIWKKWSKLQKWPERTAQKCRPTLKIKTPKIPKFWFKRGKFWKWNPKTRAIWLARKLLSRMVPKIGKIDQKTPHKSGAKWDHAPEKSQRFQRKRRFDVFGDARARKFERKWGNWPKWRVLDLLARRLESKKGRNLAQKGGKSKKTQEKTEKIEQKRVPAKICSKIPEKSQKIPK